VVGTPSIVTGIILSVQVVSGPSWLPHTEVTLQADSGETVEFMLPGANGGPPAAVLGVPTLQPGQRWQIELGQAAVGAVPIGHGLGMRSLDPQPVWNLNGNHLDDDLLPWPILLNQDAIAVLGIDRTEAALEDALDQWSSVPCSTFAFDYQGRTEAGVEDDGLNVVAWENDTWEWHAQAAAMSVVRFDVSGDVPTIRETDILFNAVDWNWNDETGNTSAAPPVLHAGSVLAHELGHNTGMDHEYFYVTSSMYLAYFGGNWMATLSGDDMRGLCENYPSGVEACATDEDCAGYDESERECEDLDGMMICDEVRDEVGASCGLNGFNCEEACLFETMFYTNGICALTCPEGSCEDGYHCEEVSYVLPLDAGSVCVPDGPDTGVETGDSSVDSSPLPDDTGDGGKDGCDGCASSPTPPALLPLLPLLGLVAHRRHPLFTPTPRSPRRPA
jgi:MYXO-CTERM domain-containing protein